jgi:hypothetical protein
MINQNPYLKKATSRPVLLTVLVFSLVGVALAYTVLLAYKSTAFVGFPASLPDYKVMSEKIQSFPAIDAYGAHLEKNKKEGADSQIALWKDLRSMVNDKNFKWIEPLPRLSKADAKDFAGDAGKAGDPSLLGYKIAAQAATPEEAQKRTALLADYVMDSTLRDTLKTKLLQALIKHQTLSNTIAAEHANLTYNASLLQKRLEHFQRISLAYPSASKSETRQVISLEKGGEKYMPLQAQMAALETEIFDIKESITRSTRRLQQSRAEGEMLAAQNKMAVESTSGRELILALVADSEARLAAAVEEYDKLTFLAAVNENAEIKAKNLDTPRFIVEPELPTKPTISPAKVILGFAFLGLLFALLYQFWEQIVAFVRSSMQNEDAPPSQAQL